MIDRLQREHEVGAQKIRELHDALERYEDGGPWRFPAFAEAAAAYAAFHYAHMRAEEEQLIPLTRAHLTEVDWTHIDAAFRGHTDRLFGVKATDHYADLFRRIVNLAPPPIGVGPP